MSDSETMKDVYTRLMEGVATGNLEVFDTALTDDYVWHGNGGQELDRAGTKEMVGGYVTAFPDMEFTVLNMMTDGDRLSVMWTVAGTHNGPMGDVPATGKSVKMRGHVHCRFEGDKIAEEWELFDQALMMEQLGLG